MKQKRFSFLLSFLRPTTYYILDFDFLCFRSSVCVFVPFLLYLELLGKITNATKMRKGEDVSVLSIVFIFVHLPIVRFTQKKNKKTKKEQALSHIK